jgi:DNA polymerase I
MEIQILDVDYVLVDEKPIIRIFGKTEGGEHVCGFYEGYSPYFYAQGEDAPKLLEENTQVKSIKRVQKRLAMGFQEPSDVWKITITNPARTPEIRDYLNSRGVRTFEADILFKYRFMADLGLSGLGWLNISDHTGTSTNTVRSEKTINIKEMKPIKKEVNAPLKTLAFDIECVPNQSGTAPEASRDPIVMISLVFSDPHKGRKSMVLATRSGKGITSCESEAEMLEKFMEIIEEYDPDMITGYNINNFDIPYLLERMNKNGIRPTFGRCRQKTVNSRKLMSRFNTSIVGRVIVDSFEIIKKDFSLMRYSLDFVSDKLLGERKTSVKHSEIEKLWRGGDADLQRLSEYCLKDSVLAMSLLKKLRLADKYIALSKVSGTLLQDTLNGGETSRIENYLLREFNKEGFVLPCKPSQESVSERDTARKEELKGGFVLEPDKGLHSNVLVLDFKSMYPSIIRTFNICPTTLITGKDIEGSIETPSGAKFVPKSVMEGIVPKILEGMMKKRQAAQRKYRNEKDPARKDVYFAEQWALKIMSNAFYGYLGYSRARVYELAIANAITSSGRNMILKTKDMIEKDGLKVVYGDTDSVMVKIPVDDMEEIRKIGNRVSKKITGLLPGLMELEFEKVFKRFLPLTKKRYIAWKFESTEDGWKDSIEMKGIETVRRDWCELVGDSIREVIDIIIKKNDTKQAIIYFKDTARRLVKGEIDIQKLVITKTMTKVPRKYAGMQPHIELVKKIQARSPGESPGIGDRIGYVIIKGLGLLSKRAEDPNYVIDNGLQIDSKYYIDNQLLPPLERIFGALKISKSELMGNGKQIGLFEAIMNGNSHEPQVIREDSINNITGFVCSKCSRTYPRPPLIGNCECGGSMLFSSPKGPVENVLVNQ